MFEMCVPHLKVGIPVRFVYVRYSNNTASLQLSRTCAQATARTAARGMTQHPVWGCKPQGSICTSWGQTSALPVFSMQKNVSVSALYGTGSLRFHDASSTGSYLYNTQHTGTPLNTHHNKDHAGIRRKETGEQNHQQALSCSMIGRKWQQHPNVIVQLLFANYANY